ncbi:MAG: septum formation initiator [Actinobacteria bacterium]|nr:septum formation initiator [Actinomycetota bacterium]
MATTTSRNDTESEHLSGWSSSRTGSSPAKTQRPLLGTDDVELLDDLLRLSAAAGVEPAVATTLAALRSRWSHHSLIVLGVDVAASLTEGFVPRRSGIVVAARSPSVSDSVWDTAASIGADQVALLPDGEVWLVDRLAAVGIEGRRTAPTVAVLGGSGGAGASSLCAAVAATGSQYAYGACAVDLDPVGTGLESLLGADDLSGLTWSDLAHTKGRVRGDSLVAALPRPGQVPVLGWGSQRPVPLLPGVVGATVDALAQSCDVLAVDLPRTLGEGAAEAICRSSLVALVVPRLSTAVVSAGRLLDAEELAGANVRLVVRGPSPGGLDAHRIAETLGVPLLSDVPGDARIDRRLEQGLMPAGSRGGLRKASDAVLEAVGLGRKAQRR